MNHKNTQGQRKFAWRVVISTLLVALTGFAAVAGATYTLPANRAVTWQGNVGVKGDIPVRTIIYKTLNPSGGDDTSAIKTAISGCPTGQVVQLGAGSFKISSPITVKSGITLRGSGMGVTSIKGASGMGNKYLVSIGSTAPKLGSAVSIAGGMSKGSTSITTATPHGWSAGDIIIVDQLNDGSGDPPVSSTGNKSCTWCGRGGTRSLGQMVKVVSVPSATTATLEIPLYWSFSPSLSPQATKFTDMTKDAGIEDLTIDNIASGSSTQTDATVVVGPAANCWLLNVEMISSYMSMVKIYGGYRNTFRGCKMHEGSPVAPANGPQYTTSRAYGFVLNSYNSANLFENNLIYHLTIGWKADGATSGNVFAYNYITSFYLYDATFQPYATTFHGGHPIMNLFEGNYIDTGRFAADYVFGTSSHNTYYRNKQSLATNRPHGMWNFDIQFGGEYYNVIGNVIGVTGVESSYELLNVNLSGSEKSIFRYGYSSDGDGGASGNNPQTYNTLLKHANWDSVHNATVWNGSDDRALPPSLYLSGKPSWWNNLQWPAIGPDVSPMFPAASGFDKGTPWGTKNTKSITPPYQNAPK